MTDSSEKTMPRREQVTRTRAMIVEAAGRLIRGGAEPGNVADGLTLATLDVCLTEVGAKATAAYLRDLADQIDAIGAQPEPPRH